ncbi:hypothetical protein HK405_003941, partial [Cladochytrium tenue]
EELESELESLRRKATVDVAKAGRRVKNDLEEKLEEVQGRLEESEQAKNRDKREIERVQRAAEAHRRALEDAEKGADMERASWQAERKGLLARINGLENRLVTIADTIQTKSVNEDPEQGPIREKDSGDEIIPDSLAIDDTQAAETREESQVEATQPSVVQVVSKKPKAKTDATKSTKQKASLERLRAAEPDSTVDDGCSSASTRTHAETAVTKAKQVSSAAEPDQDTEESPITNENINHEAPDPEQLSKLSAQTQKQKGGSGAAESKPTKARKKADDARPPAQAKKRRQSPAEENPNPAPDASAVAAPPPQTSAASLRQPSAVRPPAPAKPLFSFSTGLAAPAALFGGTAVDNPFLLAKAADTSATTAFMRPGMKRLNALAAGADVAE